MGLAKNSFGSRSTAEEVRRDISLAGKTAIVTGASAGLGVETTRVLALAGANVTLAVRNVAAGEEVAQKLRATLPATAGKLEVMELDLGKLASIRAFAEKFLATHAALHLLVNNAGVMAPPLGKTSDGFETQMGTNHLGHFLLTNLLLERIKASAPARIVLLSSEAHRRGSKEGLLATLETDPNYTKRSYSAFGAYGDSKLANILFGKGLAKRLAGTNVLAVSLHPGVIATSLSRHLGPIQYLMKWFGGLFLKSVPQGSATSVFAATAPELTMEHAGIYLSDCNEMQPIPAGVDLELAERVWAVSEKLTGLSS